MRKILVVCLIWWQLTAYSSVGWGQSVPDLAGTVHILPQVDAQALPDYQSASVASGLIEFDPDESNSTLTVHQDQAEGDTTAKAVIDWQSFNIGEEAAVHFDQQGYSDWTILNRIHDGSPSQILGQLSADGHIYLINSNGILFGENSEVNVHTLTASTLNLSNDNFLDEVPDFASEDLSSGAGSVADFQIGIVNRGQLVASENGGKIFLFGQRVVNEGVVSAPAGQIGLAAGSAISIRQPEVEDVNRIALGSYVDVRSDPGTVENSANGAILSDLGLIGLYGGEVIQNGIVRAITSPEKTSQIELLATDLVSLGAESWTAVPISVSREKFVGDKEAARIVIRGITTGDTAADTVATVKRVAHAGTIDAPSGEVTILAQDQVYLAAGSKIDVSGLWVDRSAGEDVLESYLNSIQLRDDFGQKDGILKGQRVVYLANLGSAIGDVSDAADSRELTAAEQNVAGGTIDIQVGVEAPDTDAGIIVGAGAELDFSGGGYLYGEGVRETTLLLSGNRIYSISDAPEWLTYDKVLGSETVVHSRFGVVDEYTGLYYGGAVPLLDYGAGYIEGADAGTLSLVAPKIVLAGSLDGSALTGAYQVFIDEEDVPEGVSGVLRPKSGTLKLGREPSANASAELKDAVLEEALIVGELPTASDDSTLALANVFSAEKLNESGVGQIEIHVNTELTLAADAALQLPTGGGFEASARRIVQEGDILAPSGYVNLTLVDNVTSVTQLSDATANSRYVDLVGRYFLGEQGVIDVSGDSIDNLLAVVRYSLDTRRDGGTVAVLDQSTAINELILKQGSRVDVSGGNAGGLSLRADNLVLDGELTGKALLGKNGGTLALHAAEVEIVATPLAPLAGITAADALPADRQGLTLAATQLADSGFTHLDLRSVNNLTVHAGVTLQPSRARLQPDRSSWDYAAFSGEVGLSSDGLPLPEDMGETSVSLASGVVFPALVPAMTANPEARTLIEAGAEVSVAPTGTIVVNGPEVQVDGRLRAPSGEILVAASAGDLTLGAEAKILATGWNQPESSLAATGYTPLDGGTIELSAVKGDLVMDAGALIDVSAAPLTPVTDAGGQSSATAGDPGQVSIEAHGDADLAGTIAGHATLASGRGGTFELAYTDPDRSIALTDADFSRIGDGGFDAVTLRGLGGFTLTGDIDAGYGRSLTLDAPRFSATGDAEVRFAAPWVRLVNTSEPLSGDPDAGEGALTVDGEWIDVVGDIRLDGFDEVVIHALRDLRVSDYDYSCSDTASFSGWAGALRTPGNLTLQASRIFPQVPEDFVLVFAGNFSEDLSPAFSADFTFSAGGKITTLPGALTLADEVASAGGSLTLEAGGGIDHQGNLSAPLGTITLKATGAGAGGRVTLAEGSRLSTAGSGSTQYGAVTDEVWFITDKSGDNRQKVEITDSPEKMIEIEGEEILMDDGSLIDVSGGGRVFGYQFEPGIDGSVNPLAGCLVIVADPDLKLPGEAIYLQGVDGIEDGVYSILPEEYAFREDAYVLIDLGVAYVTGASRVTEAGYRIVGGYETVQGTAIGSPVLNSYALRKAADVLEEGKFVVAEVTAGDGGDISLQAATTVVNGVLRASARDGFSGGRIAMSGENVFVVSSGDELFSDTRNKLIVDGEAISGNGFAEIELGDLSITKTVTMEEGSRLQAEKVTLAGSEKILLKSGSRIDAVSADGEGETSFVSPSGTVELETGAVAHASDGLILETSRLLLAGDFEIENSSLKLTGDRIVFLTDDLIPTDADGIFITQAFWSRFSEFAKIELESATEILFSGDFSLAVSDTLSFDAARIAGENGSVTLTAELIQLTNSTGSLADDLSLGGSGTFALTGETNIELGSGGVLIDGFAVVSLNAGNELLLKGSGGLTTDGDIAITAGQVTVSGYRDADDVYQAADYAIDAGDAGVSIAGGGATPDAAGDAGGRLSIAAGTIRHSGVIDNTAGTTLFNAVDSIHVDAGGQVLARGNEAFAGGTVVMRAQTGAIELAAGSLIDVSAGAQGDAGEIRLAGAAGGVVVNGEVRGGKGSSDGQGGSFDLDTAAVGDFSALNGKLTDGGFDERIAVRARSGDLVLDDTVTAHEVYVASDAGRLTLNGTIDASGGSEGGSVELHAGQDLLLASGSLVDASGTDRGGSVLLNSGAGRLSEESGAAIDVSGAEGGTIHLRADRETATSGIKMDLRGTMTGASEVVVEAVRDYSTTGGTLNLTAYLDDASSYMANATDIESALLAGLTLVDLNADRIHLRPGIEVTASGDLTIPTTTLADSRFDHEPGLLTVRAAGNLTVGGKLTDAPTAVSALSSATARDSWGITLIAGADGGAADPTATRQGQGNLKVNADAQVYSETGPVTLVSGADMTIGKTATGFMVASSIPLSVGSYAGNVSLWVGEDLTLAGGVVQTAIGDIEVRAGGDVNLDYSGVGMGTIRTLGETQGAMTDYWTYANGGDIHLRAGGSVNGYLNSNAWDWAYGSRTPKKWGAVFNQTVRSGQTIQVTTQGLATLGGGDLTVAVGGDYYAQTGTFGSGDLKVSAGGNLAGRFLNRDGDAELSSLGNVGAEDGSKPAVFEIGDTDLRVTSQGDLWVAAVVDPLITRSAYNQFTYTWNPAYTAATRASLTSVGGDVVLKGDSPYYSEGAAYAERERVLPATVEIVAGRDIRLLNTFAMLPAADGNLVLSAGRDIDGSYVDSSGLEQIARIIMNDGAPSEIYGEGGTVPEDLFVIDPEVRGSLLHKGDKTPIVVSAGRNIENLGLRLAKMARITADGDIRFIQYLGQNTDADNVSVIRAGGDIVVESSLDDLDGFGIEHGGPGTLFVQAGNRIDLGTSDGIRTYGSEKNASLGAKGSDLIVVAGYQQSLSVEQLAVFFAELKDYGERYSDALEAGKTGEAQGIIEEARETLILPTLGAAPTASERSAGKGDIDMVESLIRTSGGVDDIYIIAGGDANVGRTVIDGSDEEESGSDTGIATTAGGEIAIFLTGDLNVNESRVMTFGGGDILTWSDEGDINAGRGSRTAISRPPVKVVNISEDPDHPEYVARFSPPAVGSGIRALTYDPDGVAGAEEAPEIGDIYLIAPAGVIDAGEAGIAGGKVVLGATEVLNAQNVSFSFGSVGVPAASDSVGGIGALAGVSNLNETASLVEQVGGFGPREEQTPTQMVDSFIEKWIDVEVIGFDI